MKLCPQCEFIYEDDQGFCDMDGQALVHDPSPLAVAGSVTASPAQRQSDNAATTVTKIHVPIPELKLSHAASAAGSQPSKASAKWQPRGLALAALAGLLLVTLLFVVYYARSHQSQIGKAKRSSSQSSNQYEGPANAQPAPSAGTQSAASSEFATPLRDTASEEALEPSSDQTANEAGSAVSPPLPSESSPSLATGSEKLTPRVRSSPTLVAARASSDTGRAPVVIRLNNGASIKADEAWEKREGVWYRQAGMVTFLKRSRVKSIQRSTSSLRSQPEPRAEKSIAQNQPRVGKPDAAASKKDSKVTSFLKKTGRVLKKPFRL